MGSEGLLLPLHGEENIASEVTCPHGHTFLTWAHWSSCQHRDLTSTSAVSLSLYANLYT